MIKLLCLNLGTQLKQNWEGKIRFKIMFPFHEIIFREQRLRMNKAIIQFNNLKNEQQGKKENSNKIRKNGKEDYHIWPLLLRYNFIECFYHKWMYVFKCFFWHLLIWSYEFYFVNVVYHIDLWMMNHLCILGMNPIWSWCMVLLIYWFDLLVFYLGFLHLVHGRYWPVTSFCIVLSGVSIWVMLALKNELGSISPLEYF